MNKNLKQNNIFHIVRDDSWMKIPGDQKLPYKMTNDFLFRSLMQLDNETLCAFLASLLDIKLSAISQAEVVNPFIFGDTVESKDCILDVKVRLNGDVWLDIEMQVVHESDWPERSTIYLSRLFDDLSVGDHYGDTLTAIQVGILDFTPNEHNPVFYSVNKLMDVCTHRVYLEKFQLRYVDLTKIERATPKDRKTKIDQWARMFKAKKWEDLQMLAKQNEEIKNAISFIYPMEQDKEISERLRRREEYIASRKAEKARYEAAIREKDIALKEKDNALKEKESRIKELEAGRENFIMEMIQSGDITIQRAAEKLCIPPEEVQRRYSAYTN